MTVWLARHGAAEHDPALALGWSDPPLSAAGRGQAAATAARLAAMPVRRVLSSDLRRARDTATAVAAAHGLEAVVTADLRELNFGAWEGRRLGDLWAERPEEAAAWEADLRAMPASFGESFAEFEQRVLRALTLIGVEEGGPAGDVVVAHRGPLAVLHAHLTGTSLEVAWRLPFDVGSVTAVEPARQPAARLRPWA